MYSEYFAWITTCVKNEDERQEKLDDISEDDIFCLDLFNIFADLISSGIKVELQEIKLLEEKTGMWFSGWETLSLIKMYTTFMNKANEFSTSKIKVRNPLLDENEIKVVKTNELLSHLRGMKHRKSK